MKTEEKMIGVKLDAGHREMLSEVLAAHRRTCRAQVEVWIELEHEILKRERVAKEVAR